ncbi:MAG: sporulation protein YunB [Clostridia bacterium]|nr:sporulation protein YunB [Clostridia bacterium]
MRYKFYKRIWGQMRHKRLIAFLFVLLTITIYATMYIKNGIMPTIKTICESRAQAIALTISSEVIEAHMNEFNYDTLMNLNYNDSGKLMTISANITEMNKLSNQIIKEIQGKLLVIEESIVQIPLGKLLGWSIFSGYGPEMSIKIIPAGNVSADFKTEFAAQGINQTKHTVYIEIITGITVIAPFTSDVIESKNVLTVAETVIIGDIPDTYLELPNVLVGE